MKTKISPSLMCADFFDLDNTIRTFEKSGIDYLHIDIMDGHFVPNITLGTDFCKILKRRTNIPLDIHLMIEKPENYINSLPVGKNDIVSVHTESTYHLQKTIKLIKEKEALAFAAINPATPLNVLDYIYQDIDGILIMTVNPGFAGQKLIPATLEKIKDLRNFLKTKNIQHKLIEADGNVSFENAVKMKNNGTDILVAGTSSIFSDNMTLEDGIKKLRSYIGE